MRSTITPTPTTSLDRAVQRVVAGFVVLYSISAGATFASRFDDARPWSSALLLLCGASLAWLAIRAWRGRLGVPDSCVAAAFMAAGVGLNRVWGIEGHGPAAGPAFIGVMIALGIQAATLPPRLFVGTGLSTVAAAAVGRTVGVGSDVGWDALDDGISMFGFVLAFSLILAALRHADAEANAALTAGIRAAALKASAEGVQRARRRSERILHDDVIAALLAVELPSGDADSIRAAATRARDAFEPLTERSVTARQPDSDLSMLGITVHAPEGIELPPAHIPHHVSAAMTLAGMEALRNVERHAGVTEAWVTRDVTADSLTLTIRDEGAGFWPASDVGFGVTQGIYERMHEVGGEAVIDSAPGGGTTVTLSWHRPEKAAGADDLFFGAIPNIRQLTGAALVIEGWLPLRHLASSPQPVVLAALGALSCAITLVIAQAARRRADSVAYAVCAMSVQLVLLAAALEVLGATSLLTYQAWMLQFVGVSLLVIGIAWAPVVALTGGAVVTTYLAFLVASAPEVTLTQGLNVIFEPVLVAAGATALAGSIRRVQRKSRADRLRALESGQSTNEILATGAVLRQRLITLQDSLLPFLDGIISGSLDPSNTSTQTTARLLAQEARDELYLHEFLDDDLRALLRAARLAGCDLIIRSGHGAAASTTAASLLRHALDPARTERAVMVLPSRPGGQTRLRMTPRLSDEHAADLARILKSAAAQIVVTSDDESTTVSVRA